MTIRINTKKSTSIAIAVTEVSYYFKNSLLCNMFQHFDSILVLVVLLFIIISLYREWIGPAFTFMVAVVIFGVADILTPSEMLAGFANEQNAVILLLLLLGDTIRKTGVLENFFNWIFSRAGTYKDRKS